MSIHVRASCGTSLLRKAAAAADALAEQQSMTLEQQAVAAAQAALTSGTRSGMTQEAWCSARAWSDMHTMIFERILICFAFFEPKVYFDWFGETHEF